MKRPVVGLDLSLTSTGVALDNGVLRIKTPASKFSGPARLIYIREYLLSTIPVGAAVFVEGYSYSSRNGGEKLGELGGVIRAALFETGIPYLEIAPGTLKKFATGKGSAGKEEVLAEAIRRLDYQGSSNDEADALWLRELGRAALGLPHAKLPQTHLDALAKVQIPEDWETIRDVRAAVE